MSSQIQVLDVVSNKPFRYYIQLLYIDWLLRGNNAHYSKWEVEEDLIVCAWGMYPDCLEKDLQ
jgi:hypothetical protein